MIKKILLLAAFLQLVACASMQNTATIKQSPNDDKQYRYLSLENGLRVVLVSDQHASQSAAALDVHVGSAQNPKDREGLAHFLEHMLFLGTQKYPNAGEYQAFIKDNGGSHNAYTSFENTSYFFDINTQAFPEALDRFAQFFVAPLLDVEYVKREVNAVNAEFYSSLLDDNRRSLDVFRQQVNPAHPFAKFSVGNNETLADRKGALVVDALKAFYQQYYSADLMTLALSSPYSLGEMQAWVEQYFAGIKQHTTPELEITEPLFKKDSLPMWLSVKPVKDLRKLSLLFPLPELDTKQQKYLDAIAYMLGDESEGSLLSYLKSKSWAISLAAGGSLNYRGGDSFSIDIKLTEQGLHHQDQVLEAVFAAVNQLNQQGISKPLYQQIVQLRKLDFQFLPHKTARQQVMAITSGLHHYDAEDVLAGDYQYPAYKAKAIDKLAAYLAPDNVYILTFDPSLKTDRKTKIYNTPFSKKYPTATQKKQWQEAVNKAITLPKLNPFVPQNTQLAASIDENAKPKQLMKNDVFELWHQPLTKFLVPRQITYIGLEYPDAHSSAENTTLMLLYTTYLQEAFNELLYSAGVAGLQMNMYSNSRGVVLQLSGYSDKQEVLLQQVLERIQKLEIDAKTLARIKQNLRKSWINSFRQKPVRRLLTHLNEYVYQNVWPKTQMLDALDKLDEKQLLAFNQKLFSSTSAATMFVNGNASEQQAKSLAKPIQQLLSQKFAPRPDVAVAKLAAGTQKESVEVVYEDKAYALYWQGEDNAASQQIMWKLLSNMLEPAFFDQLRTQQQFGYIVFAQYYHLLDVPGMILVVQSPHASIAKLDAAVNAFLTEQISRLAWLSEAQLQKYKAVLAEDLHRPDKNLAKQSGRYWYNWVIHRKMQLKPDAQIEALESLTLAQWKEFVKSLQNDQQRQLLLTTTSLPLGKMPKEPKFTEQSSGQKYSYP